MTFCKDLESFLVTSHSCIVFSAKTFTKVKLWIEIARTHVCEIVSTSQTIQSIEKVEIFEVNCNTQWKLEIFFKF